MKKLTSTHMDNRVAETETPTTQIPMQTLTGSRPKGLHSRSHAAHLDSGAAEPHTKPAGNPRPAAYSPNRKQP